MVEQEACEGRLGWAAAVTVTSGAEGATRAAHNGDGLHPRQTGSFSFSTPRLLLLLRDGRTASAVSATRRVKVVPRTVDYG